MTAWPFSKRGIMFFSRMSAGSMPSVLPSLSIIRSIMNVASGRPAPRYASTGVVFVYTPWTSSLTAGRL